MAYNPNTNHERVLCTLCIIFQNPSVSDIYTEHAVHTTCAAYSPSGFYIASGGTKL